MGSQLTILAYAVIIPAAAEGATATKKISRTKSAAAEYRWSLITESSQPKLFIKKGPLRVLLLQHSSQTGGQEAI